MRVPSGISVVIALTAFGAACGGERGPDHGWAISLDTLPSGAVRVVNAPPAGGVEPTWVVEEELRIGTLDGAGPESFGQIKGLAVDDQGRIIVLDAQAQEVRVFGADGRHLRTLGRKGEGPGEFADANGIMLAPDGRLWVVDPRLARMSVFDVEQGFQASHRWDRRSFGFIWNGAVDGAGRVLEPTVVRVEGEMWEVLRIYDREMTPLDSITVRSRGPAGRTEAPGSFYFEAGTTRGFLGVPFYARSLSTLDPALAYWSTREGDPAYRLARWVPGGDTTLVIESPRPPIEVTPAERDSAIAAIRDRLSQLGADTRMDWSKIPEIRPAIAGIFISGEGDIWVRVNTPDPAPTTWDVFRPDGHYQGTAVAAFEPYQPVTPVVRGDRFWAVVRDELDVQYVVAGRLRGASEALAGR